MDGLIAVLGHTATHPAGVVGCNSADHGGIDGSRIRADFFAKRGQILVGLATNDAGLETDTVSVVKNLVCIPVAAADDQNRIGDGLSGEAGTRGAECYGNGVTIRCLQNPGDFCF